MLSKSDKKWLIEEIKKAAIEAVCEALTVDLEWVQKKDEETGMPLAAPKYKTEKTFLPFYWVDHLKFHEGAYRGMQETLDTVKNNNAEARDQLQTLGEFFLLLEMPMKQLAAFTDKMVECGLIESKPEGLRLIEGDS